MIIALSFCLFRSFTCLIAKTVAVEIEVLVFEQNENSDKVMRVSFSDVEAMSLSP